MVCFVDCLEFVCYKDETFINKYFGYLYAI